MAIVEIFTQTRWSCECGNLFGVSGYPVTVQVNKEMRHRHCEYCGSSCTPHPTHHSSIARPPLG